MNIWKNRTIGFWLGVAAAVLFLMADIVFAITTYSDRVFSWITFGLIMAGIVFEVLNVLTGQKWIPLMTAICFGTAFAFHLYIGLPTLSDIVNGVNFVGGNPTAVIVFGILFLIGVILSVAACFMEQKQELQIQIN